MISRARGAFLAIIAAFCASNARAAQCATAGAGGSATISGTVNNYWPATASLGSGGTSVTLGAARFSGGAAIASGDLVLIMQMQDASINTSNNNRYGDNIAGDPGSGWTALNSSGNFAFARATSVVPTSGGTLTIAAPTGVAFTRSGQSRFQVIRVPQYINATLSGTLSPASWNGSTGGVLALDVAETLALSGATIGADGMGFRGGGGRQLGGGSGAATDYRTNATNNANGSKGEGIAGTPYYMLYNGALVSTGAEGYANGSNARGAPANAGGGGTDGNPPANDENTAGGGGGGYGTGGQGGHGWCPTAPTGCDQTGGHGGVGVTAQGATRLTMGGGGGAGTSNNGTGTPGSGLASSGAAGGGVVIIRAGTITGSGTISADGAAADSTVGNDANGGGGGGGSILVSSPNTSGASLTLRARGGAGGSNDTANTRAHGPGGGGGGGFVATTFGASGTVTGGAAGTTIDTTTDPDTIISYGAAAGSSGASASITASSIVGLSSGNECKITTTKDITPAQVGAGMSSVMSISMSNPNPTLAMSALALVDSYPSGLVNRTPPGATNSCGGTLTAVAGAGSLGLSGGSLAAGATCTVTVNVVAAAGGSYTNTIPAGGATATISGRTVQNLIPAADTLTVTGAMSAGKTATVVSDPVHGSSNPYATPGAVIEYLISFTNPGAGSIDAGSILIVDALSPNVSFLNADIAGGGSGPVAIAPGASTLALGAVSYSNDGGATFAYTPSSGADPNVTHIRLVPSGSMAAASTASYRFRVVVE
ncbi:MAG: hypothetical protein HXY23_06935 [Parvularculaceae bacterium]|nr:hypothetical protein [Parvularculaceae bacterium]